MAPGYCNLSPLVQKEEVVGRSKFLDIFEMLCPKAPTSTCRVKDIAFSYSVDETDYIVRVYKKFIHLKYHKHLQLFCLPHSSENTEPYNYTAVSFESDVCGGLKFNISLYVMRFHSSSGRSMLSNVSSYLSASISSSGS